MNYTIATLRNYGGEFVVILDNQGYLSIDQFTEDEDGEMTKLTGRATRKFDKQSEAKASFVKLTTCVIDSTYNFNDRAKIAGLNVCTQSTRKRVLWGLTTTRHA
ncbi:hypothetical protein FACS18949_06120 [Clostridia bacterium]|nr:hypothetical protein FACS189425_08310 [Clostridia bacterium]GHV33086.1 hypothetical protein FACS18949_06120 [Clostridia bacterium]